MARTNLGRALENALSDREADAERQFWIAFEHQDVMTRDQFNRFLQACGRALTWRLWEIALDESDRLSR